MPDYAVFGGRLHAPLSLAGLRPLASGAAPCWRLCIDPRLPAPPPGIPAAQWTDGGLRIRFFVLHDGWRLAFDDTGTYDVSADGASWTWHPAPAASPELVQADLLGRVLALALGARGALVLHGSAVTVAGRGIVLLGARHAGKSTLAAALAAAGARLVADDMAAVRPAVPPRLLPGLPLLRLWDEAADQLHRGLGGTRLDGTKQTVAELPPERVERRETSLSAVYLLHPCTDDEADARRARLSPTDAALALVAHAKLGPLLNGAPAAEHLARAAAVAGRTPVYTLRVPRGWDRLERVAARVLDWHRPPRRAAA
jgi:hypothetical protein